MLDVSVPQIYKWDKEGISEYNPHYPALKELFPQLEPNESTNKRARSGRKQKQLTLSESDIPAPPEERPRKSNFPKVKTRKKG